MATPEIPEPPRPRRRIPIDPILGAALIAAVALTYGNALRNDFCYDDKDLIVENVYLKNASALPQILTADLAQLALKKDALAPMNQIGYYRPTIALSYFIDYRFYGNTFPAGYHLTNILLHALNSVLVFLVFRSVMGQRLVPFTGALLFAVLPVHTESVTWIAGRTDVTATTFFLLSLWLWGRARWRKTRDRTLLLSLSLVAATLAVFSKEVAAVLPAALVLVEWARSRARGTRFTGEVYGWALAYALPTALYFIARKVCGIQTSYPWSEDAVTLFLTWVKAIGLYAVQCLAPLKLNLYPQVAFVRTPLDPGFWKAFLGIGAALAVALGALFPPRALVAGGLAKPSPWPLMTLLFFLVSTLTLSNFMPLNRPPDVMFPFNERHIYLGSIGLCLLLPALLAVGGSRIAAALPALLAVWYIPIARARNLDWKDDFTLYGVTEKAAPHSFITWNNSAHSWQQRALAARRGGREDEAERLFLEADQRFQEAVRRAKEQKYPFTQAMDNLGYNHLLRSRLEDFLLGKSPSADLQLVDAALLQYGENAQILMTMRPPLPQEQAKALNNLGAVMGNAARALEIMRQPDRALDLYRTAAGHVSRAIQIIKRVQQGTNYADAQYNLEQTIGNIKRLEAAGTKGNAPTSRWAELLVRAREQASVGEYMDAIVLLENAMQKDRQDEFGVDPALPQLLREVLESAVARLRGDLSRSPPVPQQLHNNLGTMYFKLGQHFDRNSFELAAREFERVLELEPTRIAAIVNLGETYTLMGRSQDARALYERGLQRFNPGSENWQMLQQRLQQK